MRLCVWCARDVDIYVDHMQIPECQKPPPAASSHSHRDTHIVLISLLFSWRQLGELESMKVWVEGSGPLTASQGISVCIQCVRRVNVCLC